MNSADYRAALELAVAKLKGESRPGQLEMAEAVAKTLKAGEHLLVQAGTGTGKSLAYLAPALLWAIDSGQQVIVATATLALQTQLATKDVPVILEAIAEISGENPKVALLKGRSNYACLLRTYQNIAQDQDTLIGVQPGGAYSTGAQVVTLRGWVDEQRENGGSGDRDEAPSHNDQAWAQVSVSGRECVGGVSCPFSEECFSQQAKKVASQADLVITNHALLAIDAMNENNILPDHGAVIIDEAHDLTNRFTSAASAEFNSQSLIRLSRRVKPHVSDELCEQLLECADNLESALDASSAGRITNETASAIIAAKTTRKVLRDLVSALGNSPGADVAPERIQVAGLADEILGVVTRISDLSVNDVVWVSDSERFGSSLNVAPLSVAGLIRENIFAQTATILTSATLTIGGDFNAIAGTIGLKVNDEMAWRGLDVGSPFDYPRQGILYIGADLPKPGRDGLSDEILARIAELVWAADGRTLGLFSSAAAARQAGEYVRNELPQMSILCQGEAQLADLTKQFVSDPRSCLFGTLSLWQGIDAPGDTCHLVIIDRIPFPRPDDPLVRARQDRVQRGGGNGFMRVAATHAGLLLAQGAGRLIRSKNDRGVVAILDSRVHSQGYGRFLLRSLPPLWQTTDLETVVGALQRLTA